MGFQLPASKANLNDICPSYVAHAMSIANTLASVTGFVSPAIAGELLDTYGNNHTSWGIIWSISGRKGSNRADVKSGRSKWMKLAGKFSLHGSKVLTVNFQQF